MTTQPKIPALLFNTPPDTPFPPVGLSLREPNGLLAIGGDLHPTRLLNAYRHGIFPWYNDDQPLLWWSPDPRLVLFPSHLKISRSLRKNLAKGHFHVTHNQAFAQVIRACAEPRRNQAGTWLVEEMQHAYIQLHKMGYAHSVETWYEGQLVGGLYGLALGKIFFGESMFTRMTDASKVAFVHWVKFLEREHFHMIDCQVETEHLKSLGAESLSRAEFVQRLDQFTESGTPLRSDYCAIDSLR